MRARGDVPSTTPRPCMIPPSPIEMIARCVTTRDHAGDARYGCKCMPTRVGAPAPGGGPIAVRGPVCPEFRVRILCLCPCWAEPAALMMALRFGLRFDDEHESNGETKCGGGCDECVRMMDPRNGKAFVPLPTPFLLSLRYPQLESWTTTLLLTVSCLLRVVVILVLTLNQICSRAEDYSITLVSADRRTIRRRTRFRVIRRHWN
jgi:hypothetical protein